MSDQKTQPKVAKPDPKLVAELKAEEGFREAPYKDTQGHATVGFGHELVATDEFSYLTETQADGVLAVDIVRTATELATALPWTSELDEVRLRALRDMAFNLGVAKLCEFHRMLDCLRLRDWNGAAANGQLSVWYTQVGARAHRILRVFQTGVDAAS